MRRIVRLNGVTAERLGITHDTLVEAARDAPGPGACVDEDRRRGRRRRLPDG